MADIAPAEGVVIDLDEGGCALPVAAPAPAEPGVVDLDAKDDGQGLPPHAVTQPDGSVLLPLAVPVRLKFRKGGEVREEVTAELRLHRLTGADMRAISAASKEMVSVVAIARSARISEAKFAAIFDRMDMADIGAAGRVLEHFLGNGPRTGP